MYKLLNIISAPDRNRVLVVENNGNPASIKITMEGNNTVASIVDNTSASVTTVTLGGVQARTVTLPKTDIILNAICDPDTNKKTLLQAEELLHESDIPVINRPENILNATREKVYTCLHELDPGIIIPKTIKITPRSLADIQAVIDEQIMAYPFIFRDAGAHGGHAMIRIDSSDEMTLLEQFAFDGRDYYMTVYREYRSNDGLYRKARLMIVGGEAYARHLIISDEWKVHADSRDRLMKEDASLREEEEHFITALSPKVKQLCRMIYDRLKLDYFGIDCYVGDDDTLLIFEANACMYFTFNAQADTKSKYSYLRSSSVAIKEAFDALLLEKASTC